MWNRKKAAAIVGIYEGRLANIIVEEERRAFLTVNQTAGSGGRQPVASWRLLFSVEQETFGLEAEPFLLRNTELHFAPR